MFRHNTTVRHSTKDRNHSQFGGGGYGLYVLGGYTLVGLLRRCFSGFLDRLRRFFACVISSRSVVSSSSVQALHHSGAVIKAAAGASGSLRIKSVQLLAIRQHHQSHSIQTDTHNAQNPADQHEPTTGKHRTGKHQGDRGEVRRGEQKLRIHYRPT